MKKLAIYISISLLLSSLQNMTAQCEFEGKFVETPSRFKVSSSSRALELFADKPTTLVINAYGGKDYYISVFAKSKTGKVQFRIKNPQDDTIIYDNSTEDFVQSKIFSVNETKKLIIELFAPNGKFVEGEQECVSLLIAYRKTVF